MNQPTEPRATTDHPTIAAGQARSSGSAPRRRPARKNTRDSFGSVRRLPSGRFQVRFSDAGGTRHTAPDTFATRREAVNYLAVIRAEMFRGTWRAPELGTVTVADYAATLLAVRVDLAPKTRQLYEELQRGASSSTFLSSDRVSAPRERSFPAGRHGWVWLESVQRLDLSGHVSSQARE